MLLYSELSSGMWRPYGHNAQNGWPGYGKKPWVGLTSDRISSVTPMMFKHLKVALLRIQMRDAHKHTHIHDSNSFLIFLCSMRCVSTLHCFSYCIPVFRHRFDIESYRTDKIRHRNIKKEKNTQQGKHKYMLHICLSLYPNL